MRRFVAITITVLASVAVIGCGGGSEGTVTETVPADTTTTEAESNLVPVEVLNPKSIERCLESGDATVVSSEELLPPDEPINAHAVFAIGANSGARIGIVLTLKPFLTRRLSHELAEEGTYEVNVTSSEEALVMFDGKATAEDESLASECSEPS